VEHLPPQTRDWLRPSGHSFKKSADVCVARHSALRAPQLELSTPCLIRIVTARNADGFTSAVYSDRFNAITKPGDGDPFITTVRIAPTDFAMTKSHVSPFASQIFAVVSPQVNVCSVSSLRSSGEHGSRHQRPLQN